ncbi:MAG: hypothetical protein HFE94_05465 [Acutalibacter sp.]|nr:hypothetical protein [Acutalibacter sp.]
MNQWTQADAWNPHTTLLYVPNVDLDPVAQAMREKFVPFMAQVTAIEFSHVYENGYMTADVIELQ